MAGSARGRPSPLIGLARGSYDLILADPPWRFDTWSDKGLKKSADKHYRTMTLTRIAGLAVADLAAEDCLLLCWATAPLLPEQITVCENWGFAYKSMIVWAKHTTAGKPTHGPGFRVRGMAEFLIVATRGRPRHAPFRGLVPGIRREHSRKPEEIFHEIDRCCPELPNRVELFSRETRSGWDHWGDQAGLFDISGGSR